MKREITFTFRKSMVPSHQEIGNYYFTLTSRVYNTSEYIPRSICLPDESLQFYVSRDLQGNWSILGKSELPAWIYDYESSFGNAIDESLGIKALALDIKIH